MPGSNLRHFKLKQLVEAQSQIRAFNKPLVMRYTIHPPMKLWERVTSDQDINTTDEEHLWVPKSFVTSELSALSSCQVNINGRHKWNCFLTLLNPDFNRGKIVASSLSTALARRKEKNPKITDELPLKMTTNMMHHLLLWFDTFHFALVSKTHIFPKNFCS